jgi:hypothetical protein
MTISLCQMSQQGELCIGKSCPMLPNCIANPCEDCVVPMEQSIQYGEVTCHFNCKSRKEWLNAKGTGAQAKSGS